jgi:hypothetical protein
MLTYLIQLIIVCGGEPMPRGRAEDLTTLQMALVGYRYEREKIGDKIRQIEEQLKGKRGPAPASAAAARQATGRRKLSAAARRRISAAQRKRWAEHRKMKAAQAK